MSHKKEKWAEEVLASADNIQRAKAGAGFYQQTLNRIKGEARVSSAYVLRIAAGFLLLLTLNVVACVSFSKNNNRALQAFASEYSLTAYSDTF